MVVFHIDLNAFFASAEMVQDPSLRGKPVVVSGRGRKGVILTASYEARKYGIHAAMPVFEAKKLCPDLLIKDVHFELYETLSSQFIDFIRSYTPLVEQASIDECYADMTAVIKKYPRPLDLAIDIQHKVEEKYGLTCSIGIGPNKFLAKIGSDMKKPRGITVVRKREVASKLWPLPIDAIGGIGKKTAPILRDHGIQVIGDLVKPEYYDVLQTILGKNARVFVNYALGEDDSPIVCNHMMESMGQSTTLDQPIEDYDSIRQVFSSLTRNLVKRVVSEGVKGDTISISIRYFNFETMTRSRRLDHDTNDYDEMMAEVMLLFDQYDRQLPVRLLGVTLTNLKKKIDHDQISLFEIDQPRHAKLTTDEVVFSLNAQLNGKVVKKLSDLMEKEIPARGSRHSLHKK